MVTWLDRFDHSSIDFGIASRLKVISHRLSFWFDLIWVYLIFSFFFPFIDQQGDKVPREWTDTRFVLPLSVYVCRWILFVYWWATSVNMAPYGAAFFLAAAAAFFFSLVIIVFAVFESCWFDWFVGNQSPPFCRVSGRHSYRTVLSLLFIERTTNRRDDCNNKSRSSSFFFLLFFSFYFGVVLVSVRVPLLVSVSVPVAK